uniref:Uncharacterized protein n=1 Tax=Timema cristinae TaxID=61476 RepID=A0A7R9CFN6_TIMCR|nr:unnamed protein product [Timema cristinae]
MHLHLRVGRVESHLCKNTVSTRDRISNLNPAVIRSPVCYESDALNQTTAESGLRCVTSKPVHPHHPFPSSPNHPFNYHGNPNAHYPGGVGWQPSVGGGGTTGGSKLYALSTNYANGLGVGKVELEEVYPHLRGGRVENHLRKTPPVHPSEIRTSISPSSAVELNTTSAEFIRRFRFSKDTVVNVIVPLLAGPNQNARGLPVPPLIKVITALRFYGTGSFQTVKPRVWRLSPPPALLSPRRESYVAILFPLTSPTTATSRHDSTPCKTWEPQGRETVDCGYNVTTDNNYELSGETVDCGYNVTTDNNYELSGETVDCGYNVTTDNNYELSGETVDCGYNVTTDNNYELSGETVDCGYNVTTDNNYELSGETVDCGYNVTTDNNYELSGETVDCGYNVTTDNNYELSGETVDCGYNVIADNNYELSGETVDCGYNVTSDNNYELSGETVDCGYNVTTDNNYELSGETVDCGYNGTTDNIYELSGETVDCGYNVIADNNYELSGRDSVAAGRWQQQLCVDLIPPHFPTFPNSQLPSQIQLL